MLILIHLSLRIGRTQPLQCSRAAGEGARRGWRSGLGRSGVPFWECAFEGALFQAGAKANGGDNYPLRRGWLKAGSMISPPVCATSQADPTSSTWGLLLAATRRGTSNEVVS